MIHRVASLFRGVALIAAWFAAAAPFAARAADDKPEDAYQPVWKSVAELLRRREYASAQAVLDARAAEPA